MIDKIHYCWFSGVAMSQVSLALNKDTIEHIIPLSSALFRFVNDPEQRKHNQVHAASYVNNCLGSYPLKVKLAVQARLRDALGGQTEFNNETRAIIKAVIDEEQDRFRILGKKVTHNPFMNRERTIRMWSLENPHMPITQEILDQRDLLIVELREFTRTYLQDVFGLEITPEIEEAIELDMDIHPGSRPTYPGQPKQRQSAKQKRNNARHRRRVRRKAEKRNGPPAEIASEG